MSSPTAMGLPARHVRGSLNFSPLPELWFGRAGRAVSVAVILAAVAAMVAAPRRGAISVDGVELIYLTCCASESVVVVLGSACMFVCLLEEGVDGHDEMVGKSRSRIWVRIHANRRA